VTNFKNFLFAERRLTIDATKIIFCGVTFYTADVKPPLTVVTPNPFAGVAAVITFTLSTFIIILCCCVVL